MQVVFFLQFSAQKLCMHFFSLYSINNSKLNYLYAKEIMSYKILHYLTFLFQPMETVRAICRFQWRLWQFTGWFSLLLLNTKNHNNFLKYEHICIYESTIPWYYLLLLYTDICHFLHLHGHVAMKNAVRGLLIITTSSKILITTLNKTNFWVRLSSV
jgi:hypothetical protein